MLKEVLDGLTPDEKDTVTLAVITYEVGDLAKSLFRAELHSDKVYLGEAKLACSDIIAQIILLCEKHGWSFDELKEWGCGRFIERVNEAKRKRLMAQHGGDFK